MGASSLTARAGLRTVSPATRTLPARISACARSRDSARPLCVTSTSRRGISGPYRPLEDESDDETDQRADQDFGRRVAEQLAQPGLLDASHVDQVFDEPVEDLGLTARGAPQAGRVVHDHE